MTEHDMSTERSTILWCHERTSHKGGTYLNGFYSRPKTAALHLLGAKDPPHVLRTTVRDLRPGEESRYWAWWDNEKSAFMYAQFFVSPMLVDMCFQYGSKGAEDEGAARWST